MLKKAISFFTAVIMLMSVSACSSSSGGTSASAAGEKSSPTAQEVAKNMGIGLNLGNTMEAYSSANCEQVTYEWIPVVGNNTPKDYETCWGAVETTQEVIDGIKAEGFDTVRIPVFWGNMMKNDGKYTINSDYIARVKEIVDYCQNAGLYTVINIHHFDEFIIRRNSTKDCKKIFTNLWKQIAEYFKDYPYTLVFEGYNEYLGGNQFDEKGELPELNKADAYEMTNTLNQAFVDAVRSTGGKNKDRVLIVSGYWTNIDNTTSPEFVMPTDKVSDRLMVSVHYVDNAMYWTNKIGGDEWIKYTDSQIDLLNKAFTEKNIPVFMGETSSGYPASNFEANAKYKDSAKCVEMVLNKLIDNNIVPVIWDVSNGFYSRTLRRIKSESDRNMIRKISDKLHGIEQASAMRDITTVELVKEMGYGINLGNTLEACGDWIGGKTPNDFERAWGSPTITQEIIQNYADSGFGVLRIPVAWSNMISDDGTYTIAQEYIDRVKEIVDWTLDADMYAIINIHWDNGWVNKFPENKEENMKRFKAMWTQISAAFEDYGDKLMFEGLNEELGWEIIWNPWGGSEEEKKESYALANEVTQVFVDTIRSGGGNNPERHLLIPGYNTDIERTCDPLFKMPNDPAGRTAVSVHYYTPAPLCLIDKDVDWAKAVTEWGNEKDMKELETNMNMLKENYIDKGIPVIVGEYGCFGDNKEREVREHWMLTVSKAMYDIGACPVLWDTPGDECDRAQAKFRDPEFIEELVKPSKN